MKLLTAVLIFGGELLGIFLEIFFAGKFRNNGSFREITKYLLLSIPFFVVSFLLLLTGYIYGVRYYQKIWVITILSWSSIVLVEPVLNYFIFKEVPSGNTLIAGILAFSAILISIFG